MGQAKIVDAAEGLFLSGHPGSVRPSVPELGHVFHPLQGTLETAGRVVKAAKQWIYPI